jgi:hypothetical protein
MLECLLTWFSALATTLYPFLARCCPLLRFATDISQFIVCVCVGQVRLLYFQVLGYGRGIGQLSVLRFTQPSLFRRDNANVCLVFEEPMPSFFAQKNRDDLVEMGPLNNGE